MSVQKDGERRDDSLQEKRVTDEDQIRAWGKMLGKLHEGISQISGEAQNIMLRKFSEAAIEGMLLAMTRIYERDPRTFDVDEMIKNHELIENHFANEKVTITREGNIITWKSNLSYCYDPKIEHGMIKPYPDYCKQCNQFFFEGLYGIAHKGPVRVEGVKGVLAGDEECISRIELL